MANNFNKNNSNNDNCEDKQVIYSGDKQVIYWDVDDVILNSSEVIVELINQKREQLGLQPKQFNDIKDWGYKSLLRTLKKKDIEALFESDDFWERVHIRPEFIKLLESGIKDSYEHELVTKGSWKIHNKKYDKLNSDITESLMNWEWIYHCIEHDEDKNIVDMSDGILIDDNYDNLVNTNARIKILLRNGLTTDYNTNYGKYGNIDNLYIVETLDEVEQILQFNLIEKL